MSGRGTKTALWATVRALDSRDPAAACGACADESDLLGQVRTDAGDLVWACQRCRRRICDGPPRLPGGLVVQFYTPPESRRREIPSGVPFTPIISASFGWFVGVDGDE